MDEEKLVEILRFEVGRLEVGPGEMLLIRCEERMTDADIKLFFDSLRQVLPKGVTAFMVGPGYSFEVVGGRGVDVGPLLGLVQ